MKTLVWFRRDLRVQDNTALCQASRDSRDGIVGVSIVSPKQWKMHRDADCKIQFWMNALRSLSTSLKELNIPLIIANCDKFNESHSVLIKIAKELECSSLYFNNEYEFNEDRRDKIVESAFECEGLSVQSFDDRVIVPPTEIKTKDGRPYSVFTPYRRVWDAATQQVAKPLPVPKKQTKTDIQSTDVPASVKGFDLSKLRDDLWQASEAESAKRIKKFMHKLESYADSRDLPFTNGTSLLSPFLTAGIVSPRQCLFAARKTMSDKPDKNVGATTWISELAWRDFYTQVLYNFPRVSKHKPFKEKTDQIPWRHDEQEFEAWKSGNTGYPIVDAGMRQLNQTGWMHNRLRMVTAMFLTKHLLIDWRWGERYFMEKLIDGDLAANNGGWQWSASTGTDAVPYFRIFNPFSQSKRFDVEGEYIKKFCPELESVPEKMLHDPDKLSNAIAEFGIEYPQCIVEHKYARQRALDAFNPQK